MCGCTTVRDAELAIAAGADAIGMIFAPSERRIALPEAAKIAQAVPPLVTLVGVFIDPTLAQLEDALHTIPTMQLQFSGTETPEVCTAMKVPYTKVFHVAAAERLDLDALRDEATRYPGALAMFETASAVGGGSGKTFDWSGLEALGRRRRIAISGGLTPENVGTCVRMVRPYAVDVRSGIEAEGRKDPKKMRDFVRAVREADAQA
jgi:phosphoribosylanthranilate isomerase